MSTRQQPEFATPLNGSRVISRDAAQREATTKTMRSTICAAALGMLVATGHAHAQNAVPDAAHGHTLAQRLCSGCHAVESGGKSTGGRADAPGFQAIAAMPNMTPERMAGIVILPHPAMPGVPLTRNELRDIIAYIVSLKP